MTPDRDAMTLEVLIPSRVLVREDVRAVVAEGREGHFGMLPRHVDYVSALVPGILLYRLAEDGAERIFAVDQGILVKAGPRITVSVRDAVPGDDLATLRETVGERFHALDEQERQARAALAALEARFIRRFVEQTSGARS